MKKSVFIILSLCVSIVFLINSCEDTTTDPIGSDARDKFIGTWNVEESCVRLTYQVQITKDQSLDNKVYVSNFAFPGEGYDPAYGFVEGSEITIPEQNYGEDWIISGTGTMMNDNKIHWAYNLKIAADISNCEADYTK